MLLGAEPPEEASGEPALAVPPPDATAGVAVVPADAEVAAARWRARAAWAAASWRSRAFSASMSCRSSALAPSSTCWRCDRSDSTRAFSRSRAATAAAADARSFSSWAFSSARRAFWERSPPTTWASCCPTRSRSCIWSAAAVMLPLSMSTSMRLGSGDA